MTVKHVEVNEICEDQAASGLAQRANSLIDACSVVARFQLFGRPSVAEDRADFADRGHRKTRRLQAIEQSVLGWIDRVVLSSFGAAKLARLANEWARDHSSNLVLAGEYLTSEPAPAIQ